MATSITLSGQLVIKWIMNALNKYLNDLIKTDDVDYVIAGDTDSCYLNMEKFVDKFCTETDETKTANFLFQSGQRINKFIQQKYQELANYLNAYENKMDMDQETISVTGIWVAKKRYILNIVVDEGVALKKSKIKVMGLELKKSSTPPACKIMLTEAVDIVMRKDEIALQEYIRKCRKDFHKLPPQEIAFPRGISEIKKWESNSSFCKPSTPIHVKGAIAYNQLVDETGTGMKYEKIAAGNKIKFLYLKEPNPIRNNSIGFINSIPKEFGLDTYIDYNKQFKKSFIDPLNLILDQIGWHDKKTNTLF